MYLAGDACALGFTRRLDALGQPSELIGFLCQRGRALPNVLLQLLILRLKPGSGFIADLFSAPTYGPEEHAVKETHGDRGEGGDLPGRSRRGYQVGHHANNHEAQCTQPQLDVFEENVLHVSPSTPN